MDMKLRIIAYAADTIRFTCIMRIMRFINVR